MSNRQESPWYVQDPGLLEDVERTLREPEFRWLHLRSTEGSVCICGTIAVPGDRYHIEILFFNDYPDTLPQVRETAGRIPHTSDRHVNTKDGTACVCIPDEWFLQRPDSTFGTYLRGPVFNFFLSQKAFEISGQWPLGERRHGKDGLCDFYQDSLGTNDPGVIKRYLEYISSDRIKGHWECPCGSGKRLRDCHRTKLLELRRKLPKKIVSNTLKYFSH